MKKNLIGITIVMLVSVYSCQKEEIDKDITDPEALSESEVAILDNLPEATGFIPSRVVLPNGEILEDYLLEIDSQFYNTWLRTDPYENLGPQDAKNFLIAQLSAIAINLTDRSRHQIPDEGEGKPAQNGLAYSWGAKKYTVRQAPPGAGTVCTDKVYGLDCSGFIHQIFAYSGVSLTSGPANSQRKASVLESAIKSSIPALNKVKVEELGAIPIAKFENGDIIYWTNNADYATHIGIILEDIEGNLAVFQSNGSTGNNADDCLKNQGLSRGPRILQLNDPYWFGGNKTYGITRINAEISGDWEFKFKCTGNNPDFITHNLEFPTTENSNFSITKVYTDTDGSTDQTIFSFEYDKTTNYLTCNFITTTTSIPGYERKDYFSVKLERDLINYFPSQQVYVQNGSGCILEVRLRNLE